MSVFFRDQVVVHHDDLDNLQSPACPTLSDGSIYSREDWNKIRDAIDRFYEYEENDDREIEATNSEWAGRLD